MDANRHALNTPRRLPVTGWGLWLLLLVTLALGLGQVRPARAEDNLGSQLRRVLRAEVSLAERLAIVEGALAGTDPVPTVAAVRAGLHLLPDAPEVGGWLIHRALADGFLSADERQTTLERLATLIAAQENPASPEVQAIHAAVGMVLGTRPDASVLHLTAAWPPPEMVLAALRSDVGGVPLADGSLLQTTSDPAAVRLMLTEQLPLLRFLDMAQSDALARARKGLDGLLAAGKAAVPLLLSEVRRAATGLVPGRQERATRAILVLGQIHDRRATTTLIEALQSENGWLRVYAATALGDLGDPYAVAALARQCTLLGDPLRQRDQWEYPGKDNTTVPQKDWQSAPYYAIDTAAADALLRLGVRGAAGWLVTHQLDPRRMNYRIRVLQDATDALRRSVPGAPVAAYNVDQGLPLREKAWVGLVHWWHAHRKDPKLLRQELDGANERYLSGAQGLAQVYGGPSVRERMMAKAAIRLLGPLMTKPLIATIATAKNGVHLAEIAESLGQVDDPRAVEGLLILVRNKQAFVRKKALKSIGAYVDTSPEALSVLLRFLDSKRAGSRVAALEGLVGAAPATDVRERLEAWIAKDRLRVGAKRASWITKHVETVLRVVRLVQEGPAHLDAVMAGLQSEHRAQRRIWWDLVRTALDLPEPLNDPSAEADVPWARRLDRAAIEAALIRRRK